MVWTPPIKQGHRFSGVRSGAAKARQTSFVKGTKPDMNSIAVDAACSKLAAFDQARPERQPDAE